jgi:hypothetical protein
MADQMKTRFGLYDGARIPAIHLLYISHSIHSCTYILYSTYHMMYIDYYNETKQNIILYYPKISGAKLVLGLNCRPMKALVGTVLFPRT